MMITSITAYALQYPEPHNFNSLRCITLARVETNTGLCGWGECISQFPEAALAAKTIIERGYGPLLKGEDPLDVERLWRTLLARIWWYGPQGIAAFGVSAVDMALWDLAGKARGLPLCELWGSRLQDRVIAMASIHLDLDDVDWTLNEFQSFQESGYRVVKGGWGKRPDAVFGLDRKRDLRLVSRIREIVGDEVDLVIDVLGGRVNWNVSHAIHMLREFEPFRLRWVEEPLPPHQYEAYTRLRAATATRIGTGEQEWNREGYRRLILSGGVDVVQMDPGRCLGITGCRETIKLIEAHGLTFSMHSWSSALNTAASIHLLASSTQGECLDFKPHISPMQHELVYDPWEHQDGYLQLRREPGLGVRVNEDAIQKYLIT